MVEKDFLKVWKKMIEDILERIYMGVNKGRVVFPSSME